MSAILSDEFLYEKASFPECHGATIVELKNGDLVASFFGGTKERNPDCCIWVCLYLDDCRDITIDKVKTISHLSESAYIRTNNVENLMIRGFSTENALPSFLENSGKSSGIKLIGNDFSKVSQLYNEEIGQEVKEAGNLFENK